MQKLSFTLMMLASALFTGCESLPSTSSSDSHQPMWVAKDLGLKQCEQRSGQEALARMQQSLDQQQIQVLDAHCASDGMMRTQVCGAPQGKLGIYKISAFQLEKAQALGFKQVQDNQYQQVSCS